MLLKTNITPIIIPNRDSSKKKMFMYWLLWSEEEPLVKIIKYSFGFKMYTMFRSCEMVEMRRPLMLGNLGEFTS